MQESVDGEPTSHFHSISCDLQLGLRSCNHGWNYGNKTFFFYSRQWHLIPRAALHLCLSVTAPLKIINERLLCDCSQSFYDTFQYLINQWWASDVRRWCLLSNAT